MSEKDSNERPFIPQNRGRRIAPKRFSTRHRYSKYAELAYVNYRKGDTLGFLKQEFPDETFEQLETNDNDIVIMDKKRKEIIVSLRGTQKYSDWIEENSKIAFHPKGNQTKRAETARSLTEKYIKEYPDYKVKVVGHSLGGGLGYTIARDLDVDAHLYDPAISMYNLTQKAGNATQYIYRPYVGNMVSLRAEGLRGKPGVVIDDVLPKKEHTKSLVDYHKLDHYDDFGAREANKFDAHIGFARNVLENVRQATDSVKDLDNLITTGALPAIANKYKIPEQILDALKKNKSVKKFERGFNLIASRLLPSQEALKRAMKVTERVGRVVQGAGGALEVAEILGKDRSDSDTPGSDRLTDLTSMAIDYGALGLFPELAIPALALSAVGYQGFPKDMTKQVIRPVLNELERSLQDVSKEDQWSAINFLN